MKKSVKKLSIDSVTRKPKTKVQQMLDDAQLLSESLEFSFKRELSLPWHPYDKEDKKTYPKVFSIKHVSDTKGSKKVVVRWKFSEGQNKWKYGMGRHFETQKNICGPWWQIEGANGIIKVSHWLKITKPQQ